eukprot:CAMPEP_0201605442 /NCGR_PEP_ID=MMETSP0492-20130828/5254_1 /ASSEMBLY_ACC=CAM_ASM_000837 /TAXON_ID=420259 /ORGANISM="Thalassiosira gravida, Strain GMp14c1" /LENGTH=75 /DNA_ID=CAMNT_0048069687 /DNA_START=141 /DNA_END=365 /DNA_ORIENTATION=-
MRHDHIRNTRHMNIRVLDLVGAGVLGAGVYVPGDTALRTGGGGGGGGDENPQEALPNTALSSPNNNNNNTKQYST